MSSQKYPQEYRDGIVELARAGTPVAQLARDYDPSAAWFARDAVKIGAGSSRS